GKRARAASGDGPASPCCTNARIASAIEAAFSVCFHLVTQCSSIHVTALPRALRTSLRHCFRNPALFSVNTVWAAATPYPAIRQTVILQTVIFISTVLVWYPCFRVF